MKKYLFGLIAVVIAVAAVAFTSAPKQTNVKMVFLGTTPQETSQPNKWIENATAYDAATCASNRQGCKILVDPSFVTGTPGSRVFTASVTAVPVLNDGLSTEKVITSPSFIYQAFNSLP